MEFPNEFRALSNEEQIQYIDWQQLQLERLRRLPKTPETRIEISNYLFDIAEAYMIQEQYNKAEESLLEALFMERNTQPPNELELVDILDTLARVYSNQNKHEVAESLYIESLELQRKLLGRGYVNLPEALFNLAENYRQQGKYLLAEPLFAESLRTIEQLRGKKSRATAAIRKSVVIFYKEWEKYKKISKKNSATLP